MAVDDNITTVIVNNTQQELNMQVRNHHYFVQFASLAKGAKHKMHVDYNDTYQEFLMGVDKTGKKLIVTSDDCCDYKRITITELADGKFGVQREARLQPGSTDDGDADKLIAAAPPKKQSRSSWRCWKS